jgi:hypothetical protein
MPRKRRAQPALAGPAYFWTETLVEAGRVLLSCGKKDFHISEISTKKNVPRVIDSVSAER